MFDGERIRDACDQRCVRIPHLCLVVVVGGEKRQGVIFSLGSLTCHTMASGGPK